VAPSPFASQRCKTKVQFLSDPQRLRRVAGGFIRVVKIGRLRLSPEKIGEDITKKTVKNRKGFQVTVQNRLFYMNFDFSPFIPRGQN
ncbi:hypothetical protein MTR67_023882, partial [Solanum verrucosum]